MITVSTSCTDRLSCYYIDHYYYYNYHAVRGSREVKLKRNIVSIYVIIIIIIIIVIESCNLSVQYVLLSLES